MEASNTKEMREALERSTRRLEAILSAFECGEMTKYINADIQDNRAALSAPPRNCDVGTVDEQHNRHDKYCNLQPTCRKYLRENATSMCIWCFATWAQRPYETKEKGEK